MSDLARTYSLGGYREFQPPADLARIVSCAWVYGRSESAAAIPGRGHRVLPEAGVSLCFMSRRDGRGSVVEAEVMVIGPAPEIHFFSPDPGIHLEAVRLKPEWSRDLLRAAPGEHLGAMNPLAGGELRDRLARSRNSLEALSVLVAHVRRRRDEARIGGDSSLAHRVLERIRASRASTIGMDSLVREVRVSERTLRRAVLATTGLSAKHGQRIERVNRTVIAADRVAVPDWASLAFEMGFYDQPHMISEFRELAGLSPAALHAERRVQGDG